MLLPCREVTLFQTDCHEISCSTYFKILKLRVIIILKSFPKIWVAIIEKSPAISILPLPVSLCVFNIKVSIKDRYKIHSRNLFLSSLGDLLFKGA